MDIIILIFCETGFGDQYASIVTGLNCLIDLRKLGIEPKVVFSKGHKYFPKEIDLNVIYNFNSFDCDSTQVNFNEVSKITEGYELLLFTSIQVWVKQKTNILDEYILKHKNISRYSRDLFANEPFLNMNLFGEDILNKSDKIVKDKENLIGIHFRGGDDTIFSNINQILNHPFWGNEMNRVYKVIEDNSEKNILVGSINRQVCEFLSKKYSNVFFNDFENTELPMHNIVGHFQSVENFDKYVNHAKNIISEMVAFRKCKNIWSFNNFPSNFILYGVINNVNYTNWFDKSKISVI